MDDFQITVHQKDALEMNNTAVSLIASGHIDQAVQMLSSSLRIYRRLILLSPKDVTNRTQECNGPESQRCDTVRGGECNSSLSLDQHLADGLSDYYNKSPPLLPLASESDATGLDFVYTRGIKIATSHCRMQKPHRGFLLTHTTIVVFNLALANHVSTANRHLIKSSGTPNLVRAMKLYELALEMQGGELNEGNTLFTIVALNNMGVIQKEISRSQQKNRANRHFEWLLTILMTLPSDLQESQEGLLEGVFRNAMSVLVGPSFFALAA